MLAENLSIIRAKTKFADAEKSIIFLLEIITLVLTASFICSAMEFICKEMSFI